MNAKSCLVWPLTGLLCAATAFAQGRPPARRMTGPAGPTPRLADGKPDLGNTQGSWNPRTIQNLAHEGPSGRNRWPDGPKPEIAFQPWAKALYQYRKDNFQLGDPEAKCLPPGIPRMYATPFPFQIFQHPDRVLFIFEGGAHIWRVVYTDGRPHSKDPNPTFLGESIGHWEGDTLVVDTIGFNENTWLDQDGHPHTDALHTVERFTRTDERTLKYEFIIEDPKTYEAPWGTFINIPWEPGLDLMEYICQENNKDLEHMVGK
jgi:hypothetical protein